LEPIIKPYDHSENEQKGYLFEQWVVSQFPEFKFLLHEWRSDKRCGDRVPKSSYNPDLVFQMFNSKRKLFFAVECKWRAKSFDGNYPWAVVNKRIVYNKYGVKLQMPIYVAIGIGGFPDKPESSYLIPFEKIRYKDFLNQQLLMNYPWPKDFIELRNYFIDPKNHGQLFKRRL